MKISNKNYIYIDTKVQDEFRKRLAQLNNTNLKATCVTLGDSDVDYRLVTPKSDQRVLNAPFSVNAVKYPLFYSGAANGLNGYITAFARQVVDDNGNTLVNSLYEFPPLENFSLGSTAPTVDNGKNFSRLEFAENKMGYILYFQSILYNYIDQDSGLLKRFNEKISCRIYFNNEEYVPDDWQIIKDENSRDIYLANEDKTITIHNNSVFIAKDATLQPISNNNNGRIEILGETTGLQKIIYFNI